MVILEVWKDSTGHWGGRIMRDGIEDGRVDGCDSKDDVEIIAMETGIDYDRIIELSGLPPMGE